MREFTMRLLYQSFVKVISRYLMYAHIVIINILEVNSVRRSVITIGVNKVLQH